MRRDVDRQQQVTRGAACSARCTVTRHPHLISGSSPGRNAHRDFIGTILNAHLDAGSFERRQEIHANLANDVGTLLRAATTPASTTEHLAEQIAQPTTATDCPTEQIFEPDALTPIKALST